MVDRKAGKEVALGTTQIDPRGGLAADSPFSLVLVLSCSGFLVSRYVGALCKKQNLSIEKFFVDR